MPGGRGPVPKPPERRARQSRDLLTPTKTIKFVPAEAPDLPAGVEWHPRTRAWWETLRRSPQAALMMATDWDFMADTALLHSRFWDGELRLAGEIRLRVSKVGVTAEDRLRLRIAAVVADEADARRPAEVDTGGLYGDLRVVDGA